MTEEYVDYLVQNKIDIGNKIAGIKKKVDEETITNNNLITANLNEKLSTLSVSCHSINVTQCTFNFNCSDKKSVSFVKVF